MLKACILEDGGSRDENISLVELAYNNTYHFSIGMTLCEALFGIKM